jgi:hypothetical protein
VQSLLFAIQKRNRHLLPSALGPELARYRAMDPHAHEKGNQDEAAVVVRALSAFWPHWAERAHSVALAAALPPLPPPAETEKPAFLFTIPLLGTQVFKQYSAPGRRNGPG